VVGDGGLGIGGLLRPGFDGQVHDGYGGAVRWTNSEQGFRLDRDLAPRAPAGVLRVLSLGDSFTAGYRVDQSETFSKLIEESSSRAIAPTEVAIAEIEHPDLGLEYLRRFGLDWHPHAVLLGLTLGNDIAQAYVSRNPSPIGFRHGLEGYPLPEHSFRARRGLQALVQPLVAAVTGSSLYRLAFKPVAPIDSWYRRKEGLKLFDAVNGLGMFLREPPEAIEEAYRRLFQILREIQAFGRTHGIPVAVLIFPQRYQIQPGDWAATVAAYHLDRDAFDLMGPNRRILAFCRSQDMFCIDPTDAMAAYHRATGQDLYLPLGDMHWNRHGHRQWFLGARSALTGFLEQAAKAIPGD
jgi:hypothetical protein